MLRVGGGRFKSGARSYQYPTFAEGDHLKVIGPHVSGRVGFPKDEAEVSDFNGLKKSLGSNCPIVFQSVSERLPKPALKATKAEPRRQYCKLTGDGTHNCRFGDLALS